MEHLDVIVTVLGAVVLALGLLSRWLETSPLPPTVIALGLGVLLGPQVAGIIDLSELGDRSRILEGAARLTLGIGLVGVALRIPRRYPRRNWGEMTVVVGAGMVLMWAISTLLGVLILQLPLWMAALVGAMLTATDPIASTPIVTGTDAEAHVPERIRHLISFESGANDGLGYLFVFLPFLMLTRPEDEALVHWLTHTLLWEVGAATLVGLALGDAAGRLLQAAERRNAIEKHWRLVYTVAMALLALGIGRLIRTDEVLLVFAAGMMFVQHVSTSDRVNEEHGQEAVNRFFFVPIFIAFGAAIPWQGWQALGATGIVFAIAVLLLRRPPVLWLLRPALPSIRSAADALFVGWFGPIAIAAIYYATLLEHRLHDPRVWHIVSLVVGASVIAHGVSASPLTRLYGRYSRGRKGSEE